MSVPLVIVEDLHKTFVHMGRNLNVLRGIDLTIEQGDVMAIVGPSGAGKSTLMHCIGTLDIPSRGRIRLGTDELSGLPRWKLAAIRNRTVGFVFQFHHLLPEFNALENVMMPGLIQGKSRKEMEGPALALLAEVGLKERVSHRPGELSGGEQQRVALARALVLSPKLILADEPTGNLDTATSQAMHELFFDINRKHGTTIVVVTHNPAFAEAMPRVVTMRDGKIDTDERRDRGESYRKEGQPSPEVGVMATSSGSEATDRDVPSSEAAPGPVNAGFWIRALARVIDLFAITGLSTATGFATGMVLAILAARGVVPADYRERLSLSSFSGVGLTLGVGFVAWFLYHTLSEGFGGATLGKILCGLRVRAEDGSPATYGGAAKRTFAILGDGLFFGAVAYVFIRDSASQQRLGDEWGGTIVSRARATSSVAGALPGVLIGSAVYCVCVAVMLALRVM